MSYDAWKLMNGDDEAEETDRRERLREDEEIRRELRAERDWEERQLEDGAA